MNSLFKFFAKHHVIFLFLFLETISMVLLFNYNNYQKVSFFNSSNRISGSINKSFKSVADYFRLSTVNEILARQNASLRNQVEQLKQQVAEKQLPFIVNDSTGHAYLSRPAKVINNSVSKQYNYITLDKGRKDGIRADQGIISSDGGVVGVVLSVSDSYSTVISLLNKRLNISAKLKRNNYFGSITWEGRDFRYVRLNEIPFHISLNVGDTVVTSGFSTYFPEGMMIGTIEDYKQTGGENFYVISVRLAADFKSLSFVEAIENKSRIEIEMLEKTNLDIENLD